MRYLIGNWKANKTLVEVGVWLDQFTQMLSENLRLKEALAKGLFTIVILPPAVFLVNVASRLRGIVGVQTGAQTISEKPPGAYTGEITGAMLAGIASMTLVGHSERREMFGETDDECAEQVARAREAGIEPVLCIRGEHDKISPGAEFIAYEPIESIGTGNNMPANDVVAKMRSLSLPPKCVFIYGGSVTESTASDYLRYPEIGGLLVGGASLKPESFLSIARVFVSESERS